MPNIKSQRCFYNILIIYVVFQIFFITIYLRKKDVRNEFNLFEMFNNLSMKLSQEGEVDISGVYKIFIMKTRELNTTEDITIVSQCSSNHFSSVEDLFNSWDGPISVAIYTEARYILDTLWDMARFFHCYSDRVFQMQLVMPYQDVYLKDFYLANKDLFDKNYEISCSSNKSARNETKNYSWSNPYPVNLLRNVARKQALTDYIMVVDIDMIPNGGLRRNFFTLKDTFSFTSEKIVYVVPAFEIDLNVDPPFNKLELINLVLNNKARPFYIEPCRACQGLIDYNNWLHKLFEFKKLPRLQWVHPWEPFFIAKNDIPYFDERFKQYGMNRVSQICELHVAGYDFMILDSDFIVHRGFKTKDGFHKTKNKEMNENRRIYNQFKAEVKYKYPDSIRSC